MLPWILMLALSQICLAICFLPGCGKKKNEKATSPPKYKMSDPGATASPVNQTDQKDGKGADDKKDNKNADNKSLKEDKKSTDPQKDPVKLISDKAASPLDKTPAKDAVKPVLNTDNLIPQVKVGQQTVYPIGGDKDKVVSNPIVSAVTDQFPTITEPPKQELFLDKTQKSQHTDKTQKD